MVPLARALLARLPAGQVMALCGDNPPLLAQLGPLAAEAGGRLHAFGFTDRVADYMAAADLLVTKPGPGSLAEAMAARLPVVVTRNRHTIPQERFNTDLVTELGLGRVVGHPPRDPGRGGASGRETARSFASCKPTSPPCRRIRQSTK